MLHLIPLLAALAVGDSVPPIDPFSASAVAQGAAFSVHRQPTVPLVSLRMAILADDPPGYAGAGHLVQHLLLPTLQSQVARVGGEVEMERSADAIVYTLTGPTRELPYLAEILRSALRPPAPSDAALLRASRQLAEERLAEWETAEEHVRAAMRSSLFPNDISAAGTERSATRFEAERIPAIWRRIYAPERLSILAVGDVTLEDLQKAFGTLPASPAGAAEDEEAADTVSLAPLAPAQATRGWLGAGFLATELDPAAVSVTARILRDELQDQLPDADVSAEHWWTHEGQALVVVLGASAPRVDAARRALNTLASGLDTRLTERLVHDAAQSLRREMLFYSRTPDRMAEVLGRFTDRSGDPNAAETFYSRLDEVKLEDVRAVLTHMVEHTPARVEIPAPQPKPSR
jgi:predicted Zn-dependent peptidase